MENYFAQSSQSQNVLEIYMLVELQAKYVQLIKYCMRANTTCCLYSFYPIFEGKNVYLRSLFHKILTLCMVSIQEQFKIKSGL